MKKYREKDLEDVVVRGLNSWRDNIWGPDAQRHYRPKEQIVSIYLLKHYLKRKAENRNSKEYEG